MSCALMLDLAETLNPLLDKRKERLENDDEEDEYLAGITLQLIFFDGEEAFKDWTATDSIYGARCCVKPLHGIHLLRFLQASRRKVGVILYLGHAKASFYGPTTNPTQYNRTSDSS